VPRTRSGSARRGALAIRSPRIAKQSQQAPGTPEQPPVVASIFEQFVTPGGTALSAAAAATAAEPLALACEAMC
jgi:hypothetical protein